MGLSDDLILQFAKSTNDKSKEKVDKTVFGTTLVKEGNVYVKIDGSDIYTPVSTTTHIKSGERVMVAIKNHSAIITGNVSSPAVNLETELDNGDDTTTKVLDFGIVIGGKLETLQSDKLDAAWGTKQINDVSDTLSGEIEQQKTNYEEFIAKFSKYIRFMEDENGNPTDTAMTIGSGDSAITLEIDNEKGLIFKKNGVPFGSWDGVDFYTGNIIVNLNERAQFGNFAEVPRSDGSLSLLKVR